MLVFRVNVWVFCLPFLPLPPVIPCSFVVSPLYLVSPIMSFGRRRRSDLCLLERSVRLVRGPGAGLVRSFSLLLGLGVARVFGFRRRRHLQRRRRRCCRCYCVSITSTVFIGVTLNDYDLQVILKR